MGRKPTRHLNLPRGMRARIRPGRVHYFYDLGGKPRREVPLGNDYALAIKKWVELQADHKPTHEQSITLEYVCAVWQREELPKKARKTQHGYVASWNKVHEFFQKDGRSIPLESIEPQHVQQFMRWRKDAPIQATREKAVLSIIWNFARGAGFTAKPNPCQGIKGKKAKREVYVEDDVLQVVWEAADVPLREALDLAYLTGQRPGDAFKMSETDIRDGVIEVRQAKTGHRVRIAVEGELGLLIDRIKARKAAIPGTVVRSLALIVNERGEAMRSDAFRYRFDHARERAIAAHPELAAAIQQFQFRDLRAKAGTDKAEATDIRSAQKQLGHASITTTEIYLRNRRGDKSAPTK